MTEVEGIMGGVPTVDRAGPLLPALDTMMTPWVSTASWIISIIRLKRTNLNNEWQPQACTWNCRYSPAGPMSMLAVTHVDDIAFRFEYFDHLRWKWLMNVATSANMALTENPKLTARTNADPVSMEPSRTSPMPMDTICAPGAMPFFSGWSGKYAAAMLATCVPWAAERRKNLLIMLQNNNPNNGLRFFDWPANPTSLLNHIAYKRNRALMPSPPCRIFFLKRCHCCNSNPNPRGVWNGRQLTILRPRK